MPIRVKILRRLFKECINLQLFKRRTNLVQSKVAYSTAVPKCYVDIMDIFTDLLLFNREKLQSPPKFDNVDPVTFELGKNDCNYEIFQKSNLDDKLKAQTALDEILRRNIVDCNWNNVARLTDIYVKEEIPMNLSDLQSLIKLFSDSGFLKGLLQLRVLFCITNPDKYLKEGELLVHLARCYWVAGNSKECFIRLNEFFAKYPGLKDSCTINLKKIIFEAVANRSEAELKFTVSFIEVYTKQSNDFFYLAVLWNYLFLSEWFADHRLAEELLDRHEALISIVSLMSSSLARYLIRQSRINDMYRLMQAFLKYEIMDSYSIVNQILFDYYCRKGDQYACSEIVKTSARLKSSLRDEQYHYFISWCATGDPFKYIPPKEIKKIYSEF